MDFSNVKLLFSVNLFHTGKNSEYPFFAIGVGTGFKYYYYQSGSALMPFFANFQFYFLPKKVSPYLFIMSGYTFSTFNHFERVGPILQTEVGIKIKAGIDTQWLIGVGYEYQYLTVNTNTYWAKGFVPGISFNIGLLF